jgi:hypothetical protein
VVVILLGRGTLVMLNRTGRNSSRTVLGDVMAHSERMVAVGAIRRSAVTTPRW